MKYQAVIFDMDGVLVDTEAYYFKLRERFFAEQGISLEPFPASFFIGSNMNNLWDRLLGESYTPEKAEQMMQAYLDYKKAFPLKYEDLLFPDVKATLEFLKQAGYRIALASSTSMPSILECLKIHGLTDYFEVILSGRDLKESKPNPEIYIKAMEKLGVSPEASLIIEDSENGIRAGKAAGASVWAIQDELYGMNQTAADAFVKNLTEVKAKLSEH